VQLGRNSICNFERVIITCPAAYIAGQSTYNGLYINGVDQLTFYSWKQFECNGHQLKVGFGAQGIDFFGGHFETGNSTKSLLSEIDPHKAFGGSGKWAVARGSTGAYFQYDTKVNFWGTQFERAGPILVNGGLNSFNGCTGISTDLILGPQSSGNYINGWTTENSSVTVLGLGNTLRAVHAWNCVVDGVVTIGQNSDLFHAKHPSDPGESVWLPGNSVNLDAEWFLMVEVYSNDSQHVADATDGVALAAKNAGVDIKNAAGAVIETSPLRDLLLYTTGASIGRQAHDRFTHMTVAQSLDARLVVTPHSGTGVQGSFGVRPAAWRPRIYNGSMVRGGNPTDYPYGWGQNGAAITFAASSSFTGGGGIAMTSSSAAAISQAMAVHAGHTYTAYARVIGDVNMSVGFVAGGTDGQRPLLGVALPDAVLGYADNSRIVQVIWDATAGGLDYVLTIGSLSAMTGASGANPMQVRWATVIDLTEPGRLWTIGKPSDTEVGYIGQVQYDMSNTAVTTAGLWHRRNGTWVGATVA
jgi:hypothetical protein